MGKYSLKIITDTSIEKDLSAIIFNEDNEADVSLIYDPNNAPPALKSFGAPEVAGVFPVILEVTVNTLTIIDYIKTFVYSKRSSRKLSEKTKVKIKFKDSSVEKTLDIETCDIEKLKASLESFNRL